MKEFKTQKIKSVIKELLKKNKITYEDLGEQLECSVPTIKRILGPEELTLNRLLQICEIINIDLAELENLTKDTIDKEEKFTEAQEQFLAKNKPYFAYMMRLLGGETPAEIAEKNKLTARSTDKYLLALEKQGLIRVTGKQKVRPVFKSPPSLGTGVLAKVYFQNFISSSAQFFIQLISEMFDLKHLSVDEKGKALYGVQSCLASKASYEAFSKEQDKAIRDFQKLASYEEKTKDKSQLMTVVIIHAHAMVRNDYKGLKTMDNSMGEVINI